MTTRSPPVPGSVANWLLGHRPNPRARVRLLCFPPAGAGASMYHAWASGLPPEIDVCAVQLPGRQSRLAEPPYRDLAALVEACATALAPIADLPWALFGHSVGALVAFELARRLRDLRRPPCHLFASALHAPHVPARQPHVHAAADDVLLANVRELGGLPPGLEEQHPELLAMVLPTLRADLTIYEQYRYQPRPPLDCALSVFGGDADRRPRPELLEGWRDHTRGPFRVRMLPGGHFFVEEQRAAVLAAIAEDLEPWAR